MTGKRCRWSNPLTSHLSPFNCRLALRLKRLIQYQHDGGAFRQHDVAILGLDRALRADRTTEHAADNRALGAATEHPPHDRADCYSGGGFGDVTRVGLPALKVGSHAVDLGGQRI